MNNSPVKKRSKQREAVLKVLCNTVSHPTADWIYRQVREVIPNISLGTVYRNLSVLAEDGLLIKLDVGDGIDRFDACCAPHYHFVCDCCRKVSDIAIPYTEELDEAAEKLASLKIRKHELIFYGLCAECKNN